MREVTLPFAGSVTQIACGLHQLADALMLEILAAIRDTDLGVKTNRFDTNFMASAPISAPATAS